MNTTVSFKLTLQLVQSMLFLLIYLHISACIWFIVVSVDEKWIPGQTILFGKIKKDFYTDFSPFG